MEKQLAFWEGDFRGINGADALVFARVVSPRQVHLREHGELRTTPLHHICDAGDPEICAAPHPKTAAPHCGEQHPSSSLGQW